MPRIELVTGGTPSPTIDLCRRCSRKFVDNEPLSEDLLADLESRLGKMDLPENVTIGSTDVAHPLYEYEVYTCNICGVVLSGDDA